MKIRTMIVDDHPLFRKGLKAALNSQPEIEVVGEAGDSESAIEMVKQLSPDVVILDINLPGKNGIEIAGEIKASYRDVKIVFLTMHNEEDLFNAAFNAGASGYLLKENAVDEVISAVIESHHGGSFISHNIAEYFVNRKQKTAERILENPGINDLTNKEKEIICLISIGKTSKEIADELFLSYKTIENHRTRICNKLGIKGSFSLLKFAIENRSIL